MYVARISLHLRSSSAGDEEAAAAAAAALEMREKSTACFVLR
jgi:hypothetical protein